MNTVIKSFVVPVLTVLFALAVITFLISVTTSPV